MLKCNNCGYEAESGKFCRNCGAPMTEIINVAAPVYGGSEQTFPSNQPDNGSDDLGFYSNKSQQAQEEAEAKARAEAEDRARAQQYGQDYYQSYSAQENVQPALSQNGPILYDPISLMKNLFVRIIDFGGVTSRKEYWLTTLYASIALILMEIIAVLPEALFPYSDFMTIISGILAIAFVIISLGISLAGLAMGIRRLHDNGKSGAFYLLCLVPLVGSIILLVFFCMETKVYNNPWRERDIAKGYPVLTPAASANYTYRDGR